MLAEPLDRLLASRVDAPMLRAAEAGKPSQALASEVEKLGLATALVPEDRDGAGLGWADLGGVFQTLGYHAAPLPLGEAIIAQWALARLGQPASAVTPALALDALEGDATVSGVTQVPWGLTAAHVLATARTPRGDRLCLVSTEGADRSPVRTVGRDPAAKIKFRAASVIASIPSGPFGLHEALAVLRAGQIAGALSRILELSIDYANTRVQFGRPIGKFQAIQHLVAGLAGEAACAKAAFQLALTALDAAPAWQPVAVAKIRASLAVSKSTFAAHETHGAIGVTEDHSLHFYTRRLWQWRDEAGNEHAWSERLGRDVLAGGAEAFWPRVVSLSNN